MPCICFLFGRVIGPGKRASGPVCVTKAVDDVRRFADSKGKRGKRDRLKDVGEFGIDEDMSVDRFHTQCCFLLFTIQLDVFSADLSSFTSGDGKVAMAVDR